VVSPAVRVVDRVRDQADWSGVPAAGVVRYSAVSAKFSTPTKTVYASDVAVGDADASANTGTDNTAALNAALAGGNVVLVLDGLFGVLGTLAVESNSKLLRLRPTDGVLKLVRSGINGGPCVTNKNHVTGPTTPTDHDIEIDCCVDGNRRNYGSGSTADGSRRTLGGSSPSVADPANAFYYRRIANDDGYVVPGILMVGVNNLKLRATVYDPPAYGSMISNCQYVDYTGYSKWSAPGDTITGNDIVHINGYCSDIWGDRITGTSDDDAFALNADDGDELVGPLITFAPGTNAYGPIARVKFTNPSATCGTGMRLLSARAAASITDVTLENYAFTIKSNRYTGVLADTFNDTGDGTQGWLDNINLINGRIVLDPAAAGEYAAIHLYRCRFGTFAVNGLTADCDYGVVRALAEAIGDRLVLNRVEPRRGTVAPFQIITPNIATVEIDGARWTAPQPAGNVDYPVHTLVDVRGAVGEVNVTRAKVSGGYSLVQCRGAAPASVNVSASKLLTGGPAVVSDTALPRLSTSGIDADHVSALPTGSSEKHDGSGWYGNLFLFDQFRGTAADPLAAHLPDYGPAWLADAVGAGKLRLTGTNWVYFATGGDSSTMLASAGQPTTTSFEVEFDVRRLSVIAGGDYVAVTLFATTDLTDFYAVRFSAAGFALVHNGTVIRSTTSLPAADGTVWRVRVSVYDAGSNAKIVVTDYSTNGGRGWNTLLSNGGFTTTTGVKVGLKAVGAGGTAAQGHQLRSLIVRSFNQPTPSVVFSPADLPSALLILDRRSGLYQTPGGSVANAGDPLGDWLGLIGEAQQTTAGTRLLVNSNGISSDGSSKYMTLIGSPLTIPTSSPFTIYAVGSRSAGNHLVFLAGRPAGTGPFLGVYTSDTFYILLDGTTVYSTPVTLTGKFVLRVRRDAAGNVKFAATGIIETTMSGGTTTQSMAIYEVGARTGGEYSAATSRICQVQVFTADLVTSGDDAAVLGWLNTAEGVTL
jgi:hypothetical protein